MCCASLNIVLPFCKGNEPWYISIIWGGNSEMHFWIFKTTGKMLFACMHIWWCKMEATSVAPSPPQWCWSGPEKFLHKARTLESQQLCTPTPSEYLHRVHLKEEGWRVWHGKGRMNWGFGLFSDSMVAYHEVWLWWLDASKRCSKPFAKLWLE